VEKGPQLAGSDRRVENCDILVHRDGHEVKFLDEGVDESGEYLVIRHTWTRPGPMAGPHWHPVLRESFAVEEGRMRFCVDRREFLLGPGERVTIPPRQVHRFWNEGEGRLMVVHEVRPPGRHRAMFELWHRLDREGKTTQQGVPRNPLWMGLLWEYQDGYIAGIPPFVQRIVLGGLARLARLAGYGSESELAAPLGAYSSPRRARRGSNVCGVCARSDRDLAVSSGQQEGAGKVTPGKAEVPRFLKPANRLVVALQRAGLVIGPMRLLSVPGRESGRMRTTPVSPLTVGGQRYIVAVFEGARWVENARAAGWGVISRGRKRERVDLVELPPEERVLVLREVPREVPRAAWFLRQRYGISDDPDAFAALAQRCSVFRTSSTTPRSSERWPA